jgi:hypothetical protein
MITTTPFSNSIMQWMRTNNKNTPPTRSPTTASNMSTVSVLWRCSVNTPDWRATSADSIDFATYVLGYATNYLPVRFFAMHAA